MKPKNTICLWFDKDAHEAARFYSVTFPDSKVAAVHEAPGDYPGGKKGDVLTVEFTVMSLCAWQASSTRVSAHRTSGCDSSRAAQCDSSHTAHFGLG
jgi:predicted 3-demethylubiquinone-9 3-methyltransferase (glyoxalase superfamily)